MQNWNYHQYKDEQYIKNICEKLVDNPECATKKEIQIVSAYILYNAYKDCEHYYVLEKIINGYLLDNS